MRAEQAAVGALIVAPCGCQAVVTAVSRTMVRFRVTRALGCRRFGRRHIGGIDWDDCRADEEIQLHDRRPVDVA